MIEGIARLTLENLPYHRTLNLDCPSVASRQHDVAATKVSQAASYD